MEAGVKARRHVNMSLFDFNAWIKQMSESVRNKMM